ncbi:MAG TPA: CehA/McbA family metallohydrolase [Steroidobacteraceae bacterium]|nr:CehA/McbA family metallohydrolase [Steroidobacteraceae bacterium]
MNLKVLALVAVFLMPLLPAMSGAAVRVIVGPTPIEGGEAKSAGDITLANEKLAFALAVESPVPYGVPRGAIIDVAPVVNGTIGADCVVFADFIPNNWSAWPNTFQHVDILERGPDRAVVRAVRDWGKVIITTIYTLESNADSVDIRTTMSNGGAALSGLLSGLTLWPKRGYFFAVPGLAGMAQGKIDGALADRVVAYDDGWSVALHAPYVDHIADGSLDLYQLNSLAAGESRSYEGWLQVGSSGDLKPVVEAEIKRKHLASGAVSGKVTGGDGKPVDAPVVVIQKQGKPYAWVLGRHGEYQLTLPVGDYTLYATAKNYSESPRMAVRVTPGAALARDFRGLRIPGSIRFAVTDAADGKPLDARISILEGQKPVVEFLGRRTFFTELDRKGRVDLPIAPGDYVFNVSAGGGFLSPLQRVKLTVAPGEARTANVAVSRLFDPPARHWYSADLHHHADQAEAVTPPADLARSQLAAGLDLLFVSDHDSTANHGALQAIADRRGIPFIPGIELSTSWGHFNAYPLLPGQTMAIDTGTANIDAIIAEARRMGASVVQVNHPFIPYGYFTSLKGGVAPGGFNPGFDLIEINSDKSSDDPKVLQAAWNFWNAGHRYYLSAGTDTHDVWRNESGAVRAFAHVDGTITAQAFAQALKLGHGYVTYGPLIFPSVMFGDELRVKPGEPFTLGFDLKSVAGIRQAELIERGAVLKTQKFAAASRQVRVDYTLTTQKAAWYSLIVEDDQGHKAYTDPIWVDAVERPF